MGMVSVTNNAKGIRVFNASVDGNMVQIAVGPGETVEMNLTDRDGPWVSALEKSGEIKIIGKAGRQPKSSAPAQSGGSESSPSASAAASDRHVTSEEQDAADQDEVPFTAQEILDALSDGSMEFFKARQLARDLLGDPSLTKKGEIIAALQRHAEED